MCHPSNRRAGAAVALLLAAIFARPAAGAAPAVAVSVAPVHSLVAGVMEGVGVPALIMGGSASPHGYRLRPSEAAALHAARIIFWVGPALESSLVRPLAALGPEVRVVELLAADGIELLAADSGRAADPHLWLAPANAGRIVRIAARALAAADPANAAVYAANAARLGRRIAALDAELRAELAPLRGMPYAVFHDAYRYFERAYGLEMIGALLDRPDEMPSAKRVRALARRIKRLGVRCVFREPQADSPLLATVIGDSGARTGVLDPLGAGLAPGPDLWFNLMRANAAALMACLAGPE